MKQSTFASFSFGCRVNHAEREEIDRQMVRSGFTQNEKNPTIFIINTCSITHKAEREARQLVYQTKKNRPETKIVVTGCSATYWLKTGTYKSLPIDLLVDNTNKEYLVTLLKKRLKVEDRVLKVDNREWKVENNATDKFLSTGRLVVKIQDGCHRFCSFCIVPYLRGLPKSEKIDAIIARIKGSDTSINEIIYTAINTEAFGKDTDETFLDLIKKTLSKTKFSRISFGSVHPWSITDEFIDFYNKAHTTGRLVKFFHIPLQSGSNRVLTLMKRCHTREDMMGRVKKLNEVNPHTFISTDVIVGFLEETDEDFQDTYDFLKQSPIHKFHVFRYSKRAMTASYYLGKRLKEPTVEKKKERSKLLRQLSDNKYVEFQKKLIGYSSPALFLSKKNDFQEALLDNQIPVFIKNADVKPGMIQPVIVTDYKKNQLFARIV